MRAAGEKRLSKNERAATQSALRELTRLQESQNATKRKLAEEVAEEDQLNKTSKSLLEKVQEPSNTLIQNDRHPAGPCFFSHSDLLPNLVHGLMVLI